MTAPTVAGSHLVIGECIADVVTSASGATQVHPGGSPANVAFGLCRLGRSATLLTTLGDDEYGALIRDHLEDAGVRVVSRGSERPTATAAARLDETGAATYTFDIEWSLPSDLDVQDVSPTPMHVHTGSVGSALEPGASAVVALLESLRPRATVSFDPNIRPALFGAACALRGRFEGIVRHSDVVKASDEDLEWLYPGVAPLVTAGRWLESGPSVVVVTQGAAGSVALCRTGAVRIAPTTTEVIDTVGAGDSFMSALLDGLQELGLLGADNRPALATVPTAVLDRVCRRASRAAAITVSRAGAMPPTRIELGRGDRGRADAHNGT